MYLTEACITLNVSRSGYHAHPRKHPPPHRRQVAQLATEIRAAFCASRQTHARVKPPRVPKAPLRPTHHPPLTELTRSTQPLAATPAPNRPNEVSVTDITYHPTREGLLYIAAEMDLNSRRILGWSTREDFATALPNAASWHARQTRRSNQNGLLDPSDRGCQ